MMCVFQGKVTSREREGERKGAVGNERYRQTHIAKEEGEKATFEKKRKKREINPPLSSQR